tara:strand:+ start:2768 stop:3301 length:534 start_codon:yes stop_codon:yes gene_type:complete
MSSNKLEINDLQYLDKYNGVDKTIVFKITNTTDYNSVISLESSISENTLSSVVLSKHILLNFHLDKKCNFDFAEDRLYTLHLRHAYIKSNMHFYKVYKILESNTSIDMTKEEYKNEDDVFDIEEIDSMHEELISKLKNKYDMKYNQIQQCYADLEIYKKEKTIECINIMIDLLEKNL